MKKVSPPYYKASKSQFLRPVLSNVFTALGVHWFFQSILQMDHTERCFKLAFDAVLTILFFLILRQWLSPYAAILSSWLVAHTVNFLLNGHIFCVLKSFGRVTHDREAFEAYTASLANRLDIEPSIAWAAAYGSLTRGEWKTTSDLDVRVIRLPGLFNGIRACFFILGERTRAHLQKFPLDILLLDSPRLLGQIRKDESPFVLYQARIDQQQNDNPKTPQMYLAMKRAFLKSGVLLLENIDLFIFAFLAGWSIITALRTNQYFQDRWILQGMWMYILLMVGVYVWIVYRRSNLQQIALVTCVLASLLYILPALKYAYAYLSTSDVATHVGLSRAILETGKVSVFSSYSSTPGFHVLVAIFSQISSIQLETVQKFFPGLLGGLIPLCYYLLCQRSTMPIGMSKWIIALSGLSLPFLYTLNGTSFTLPAFFCLLTFLILRAVSPQTNALPYTFLIFLFILQVILWHPSTSFVIPIYFMLFALAGFLLNRFKVISIHYESFFSIGVFTGICTFFYWMYDAHYVWENFLRNVQDAVNIGSSPELLPERLFEISLTDQLVVALVYHARDGIFIALAICAVLIVFLKRKTEPIDETLKYLAVIFGVSMVVLAGVFTIQFGTQGYGRFLIYCVVLSPALAGYAIWKIAEFIHDRSLLVQKAVVLILILIIIFGSFLQIYPNQTIVPVSQESSYDPTLSPIVWVHQVNSIYQYYMIDYALTRLKTKVQILADYVSARQEIIFFGLSEERALRSWDKPKAQPALVLLHWPGSAGGYQDQVEMRSVDHIQQLRMAEGMNIIYDNGYSFILFYPGDFQLFDLEP